LAELGFSEGRDVTVEYHLADGHPERLSALAADLVRRRPLAIIAPQGFTASAAKAATRDIPIIFTNGTDPVEVGLVAAVWAIAARDSRAWVPSCPWGPRVHGQRHRGSVSG
jgi:putative tryptophan/tyrosine transport system substrate-binding protein